MEDVLEIYKRPYDAEYPVVNFDETNRQLIGEVNEPLPSKPGKTAVYDYEYVRKGVADFFMMFEPLRGWRQVKVSESRKREDFARCLEELAERHYPDAKKIILVLDNLNIHTKASLYATFPPEKARALAEKFEFHFTPKHGSWLNMAELEIGALSRQCLNRRIPSLEQASAETEAWVKTRNAEHASVHWHFTTQDARVKLQHLYPQI